LRAAAAAAHLVLAAAAAEVYYQAQQASLQLHIQLLLEQGVVELLKVLLVSVQH
jgi:hypothetical protein